MNPIAQLLSADRILLDLEVSSKKRVFEQAGFLFESQLGIARALIFDSLFSREKLGSTGIGQGVAIPHGRIKGLKAATAAFFRLSPSISFDSPDGLPVSLLFILLVPEQATEQHLEYLSELAQRFSDRSFREAMMAAATPQEAHHLLTT